jgi:hypothetical protein
MLMFSEWCSWLLVEKCDLRLLVVLAWQRTFCFLDTLKRFLHHFICNLVRLEVHLEVVLAKFAWYPRHLLDLGLFVGGE